MELESRVEAFVRRHGIFVPGSRIVIACSGGPDSLALASILLAFREKWRLSLALAHFEHGIRGEASHEGFPFAKGMRIFPLTRSARSCLWKRRRGNDGTRSSQERRAGWEREH